MTDLYDYGLMTGLFTGLAVGFGTYEPESLRTAITAFVAVYFLVGRIVERNKP